MQNWPQTAARIASANRTSDGLASISLQRSGSPASDQWKASRASLVRRYFFFLKTVGKRRCAYARPWPAAARLQQERSKSTRAVKVGHHAIDRDPFENFA